MSSNHWTFLRGGLGVASDGVETRTCCHVGCPFALSSGTCWVWHSTCNTGKLRFRLGSRSKNVTGWWFPNMVLNFHPYLGKWSILKIIFFRWLETTNWIWIPVSPTKKWNNPGGHWHPGGGIPGSFRPFQKVKDVSCSTVFDFKSNRPFLQFYEVYMCSIPK